MASEKRWFHADLDAFFASVEQGDDPSLKGRPVVVGALPGNRGVVSACSYEARRFGIHSAMPISEAYRRCPGAVFLQPRMGRYSELSRRVMGVFGDFTPDFQQVSIDEAYLDMTGTEALWGPPLRAGASIRDRVRSELGLGLTIGIASNRYVAKLASSISKPDGLRLVESGGEAAFMAGVPLAKLWGAGEKTQERFAELGIRSIGDLLGFGREGLERVFGKASGAFLFAAANGLDPCQRDAEPKTRSMSAETTFERDVSDRGAVLAALLGLSSEIAYRAFREGQLSRTVTLKLRFQDFATVSARRTFARYVLGSDELCEAATALLDERWDGRAPLRLVGLGLADLERSGEGSQGELFEDGGERRRKVERTVFEIERKGLGTVTRARLLGSGRRGRGKDPEGGSPGGGNAGPGLPEEDPAFGDGS